MNRKEQSVVLARAGRLSVTASTPRDVVLDFLVPASGVAGPGAILVKRKEKPSRRKTMLLVSGWMAAVPSSLPLPAVNFSLSIPAFHGDGRRGQPARYYPLLITVPENCFPRGSQKRRVCNADNAQLPAYSGLQLPVCNAQRVQRANGSALHPGSKNRGGAGGLWGP